MSRAKLARTITNLSRTRQHLQCTRAHSTSAKIEQLAPEIYDVVIVGGGPVGLALLATIKSQTSTSHLQCALIESQSLRHQKLWELPSTEFSNRASSITPTNQAFLELCGAWRHLDHGRIQPYDEMQVWDGANSSSIQFDWRAEAVKYNAPLKTVATMTENSNLSRALLRRIDELGAQNCLLDATSVSKIEYGSDEKGSLNLASWPVLTVASAKPVQNSRKIAARLLVGADGINSPVRTFAGIETHGWDYGRHGVVATLKLRDLQSRDESSSATPDLESTLEAFLDDNGHSTKHDMHNVPISNRATAFQRFLPALGGPIAVLPLPGDHASLVWSTTPKHANYLKSLSLPAFVAVVNAALRLSQTDIEYMMSLSSSGEVRTVHQNELEWRLQHTDAPTMSRSLPVVDSVLSGSVASFPLRLRNSTSYVAQRVALAGDAAHTIHPLAGQGLNLGLGDASALAASIEIASERGRDIGDLMSLEGYSRERYAKAVQMSSGVDLLNSMYQLGAGQGVVENLVGRARGLGMWTINQMPGMKEMIMRQAD